MQDGQYNLADLGDNELAQLLAKIEITEGPQAEADLLRAARELFGVDVTADEVKEGVWLITIPMPAPRAGELEAVVRLGGQKLPNPIWRPAEPSRLRQWVAHHFTSAGRLPRSVPVMVMDVGRWDDAAQGLA
jgi:hypothetical protein